MIEEYIYKTTALINNHLDTLLAEHDVPYNQLFKAARYAVLGGGKRLRPLLVLSAAEVCNGFISKALSAACAIEMIHAYSLIHDDLPCMDDDDFRRGRPSLHRAFPESLAVLTGDFLLTYAFEIISKDPLLSPEIKIKLINLLSHNAGGHGMIAGQVMDIEAEGKLLDQSALEELHRCKTGALITAAVVMGGIVADAEESTLEILRSFGRDIGLAFQIEDDLLDLTASVQKHGKATSSDVAHNKMTYVKLWGIDKTQAAVKTLKLSAKHHLQKLPTDCTLLFELTDYILDH